MRFLDYCAVTIEGIPVYKLTLRLKSGWNLVGSMCGIARVYHVYAYTKYWTWNLLKKKYILVRHIVGGKGYWIHSFYNVEAPLG